MIKNHAKTEKLFARLKFWQQMTIVMGASGFIGIYLDVAHYERSHDHLTASYDEVWEHPMVSQANEGKKGAAVLGSYFFTLYALKAEHEVRDWRPAFKFIFGRIGNTTVLNIN